MKLSEVLRGLEQECEESGIRLIYDDLQSEGGLCRLRGSYYVIINRRASAETRVRIVRSAVERVRAEAQRSAVQPSEAGVPVGEPTPEAVAVGAAKR